MKCPYCEHDFAPTSANLEDDYVFFQRTDFTGFFKNFIVRHVVCPNEECKKSILEICVDYCDANPQHYANAIKATCIPPRRILPEGISRRYPDYIPQQLRDDYEEACKIVDLSPKASATLARRCLQGIIRDFHGIKRDSLFEEVNALKGTIEPVLWDAIDAVRGIGNIGAHMEKDVNVIVDIDPDEARQLIGLIEMLFDEWYVQREERAKKLQAIKALGDQKRAQKKGQSPTPAISS